MCSTPSQARRTRQVCFPSWLTLIAAIPNMERIYLLSSLPGVTRHWNLQLTLMQVLSGGIFNLCLSPFTFFQPQSSLQTIWCDSTMCWAPVFCDKCNDKYTHSTESVPLWKLGHTWCICVINTNATWALFLGNITFFFFACVSLHKVLMAFCPYLPLNSVTWKEGYIPQTGITLHCSVSFKIVRASNAMKTSHLLPSSTSLPESFLLSLPSSLDILNLPASVTAWSLDCHRSLTPASCPMQPPWETQLLFALFSHEKLTSSLSWW